MPDFIPAFSLSRQGSETAAAVQPAVARVLASGRFAQGPECEALEAELGAFLGGPPLRALTCASGTDALHLALRAVGVGPGEVVLTTPFSFFATAGAILLAGARPEFVDIEPSSFNLDVAALGAALERPRRERVAAIVPVHLYGRMAAMPEILAVAAARGIPVIEDAAQAIGASLDSHGPAPGAESRSTGLGLAGPRAGASTSGTRGAAAQGPAPIKAGAWGTIGCFSFYPTKNLGAMGEGGLLTTANADLYDRLRLLRVHGSRRRYEHEILGWNARMHELQAAILRAKLPALAAWNRRRAALAALYEERLRGLPVTLPERVPGHVFHQYVMRAPRRDQLRQYLLERQIGTEVYYPIPLHQQPALRNLAAPQPLPEAERAAAEVLALPMFPELTDAEAGRVGAAIAAFYR